MLSVLFLFLTVQLWVWKVSAQTQPSGLENLVKINVKCTMSVSISTHTHTHTYIHTHIHTHSYRKIGVALFSFVKCKILNSLDLRSLQFLTSNFQLTALPKIAFVLLQSLSSLCFAQLVILVFPFSPFLLKGKLRCSQAQ